MPPSAARGHGRGATPREAVVAEWRSPNASSSCEGIAAASPESGLVCVATSVLCGDAWDGEVRVLRLGGDDAFTTESALRTPAGASCCAWVGADECFVVGGDDGDAWLYRRAPFLAAAAATAAAAASDGSTPTTGQPFAETSRVGSHDAPVAAVCCIASGPRVVTAGLDGAVRAWDLGGSGGDKVREWSLLGRASAAVPVGAREGVFAVADDRGNVQLLDVRDGAGAPCAGATAGLPACSLAAFESDLLVGRSDGALVSFDMRAMRVEAVQARRHRGAVRALAVHPATGAILSGGDDGAVHGLGAHGDFVRGAAYVGSAAVPVTASWDGSVAAWRRGAGSS